MSVADDLKRWGNARNARYDRPTRDEHVLSRARDFAPMTRAKAEKRLMGRDGISRRLLMGAAAGRIMRNPRGEIVRVLPVPIWACDPVPSRNDAGPGFDAEPWSDPDTGRRSASWVDLMPDDLLWIERALASLERRSTIQTMVVRQEFCETGTQRMKAARVAEEYGGRFTYDMYRKELRKAMEFLEVSQVLDKAA